MTNDWIIALNICCSCLRGQIKSGKIYISVAGRNQYRLCHNICITIGHYLWTISLQGSQEDIDREIRQTNVFRLLCWDTLIFLILFLPAAFLLSVYQIKKRIIDTVDDITERNNQLSTSRSQLFLLISVVNTLYFVVHPLVQLHLYEDMSQVRWCHFKYRCRAADVVEMNNEPNPD